ncbi:hypothetical protein [Limosilactobacillus difficilis]|uniref:hypothetical protein n=1 Tax=Limosilactobacillus difficilis TaxID=2991838 RepID=UPI0024BA53E6|nr:hypothetical protein [Limosilactobacillus difficilis]
MSAEGLSFADLSEEAQKTALDSFADFYVAGFKADDLEIINMNANDEDMAMINHLIGENKFMTNDNLKEVSLARTKQNYLNVIKSLDMTYTQDGQPSESWVKWTREHRKSEPSED